MANLAFNDMQSRTKEVKVIVGRLRILGNATPANGTFSVVEGREGISSITRTGTGKYKINLSAPYQKLMGCSLTMLAATAIDLVPQIVAESVNAAAPYVEFQMCAGATPTDTANGVTQDVFVTLHLKNGTSR